MESFNIKLRIRNRNDNIISKAVSENALSSYSGITIDKL
jgi:hypothetical protein